MRTIIRLLSILVITLMLTGCEGRHREDGPQAYMKSGNDTADFHINEGEDFKIGDCVLYDAWDGTVVIVAEEACDDGGSVHDGRWIGRIIAIRQ